MSFFLTQNAQKTLSQSVSFSGYGLHTGKHSQVTLYPAKINTGIVFRRIDKKGLNTEIPALWNYTQELPLCTCLVHENGIHVRTVEHLIAACYACGIDNVRIDIEGEEVPIMDGSALPFVEKLSRVVLEEQKAPQKILKILKSITYSEGKKTISIEPAEQFELDVTISLSKIGRLNWQGVITPEIVQRELVFARTFGRLRNGLLARLFSRFSAVPVCLGAAPSSAIVILGKHALNSGGLRSPDEYVRHRVLDVLGDMCLVGAAIRGKVIASSSAHRLNHLLLQKLFSDKTAWQWEVK